MARRTPSYAKLVTSKVQTYGQDLTVERAPTVGGGQPTFQTIRFIPQPDGVAAAQILAQGGKNAANANPHIFVAAPDQDVQAVVDRIHYQGFKYKVSRVNNLALGAGTYAYGVRDGEIS